MPSRSHWSAYALLLALLGPCAPSPVFAQAGRVHGRVVDADSGNPIRGASVSAQGPQGALSSMSVISDAKGRFGMIGLRSGMWLLTAAAPDYESASGLARVQSVGSSDPLEFKLVKKPAVSVSPLVGLDPKALTVELQGAHDLLDQQKVDESIAAYRAILEKLPVLTTANLQIARAYRLKKDFAAAMQAYDAISPSDPRHGVATIERALAEMERGDLVAADRVLSEGVTGEWAGPEMYFSLAEIKRARALSAEAEIWYKKASETDPGWARPYVKLGVLAVERGDHGAARGYLERAIGLQPVGPDADEARAMLERATN